MIYDLKRSVDQRLLFDPVLHSSFRWSLSLFGQYTLFLQKHWGKNWTQINQGSWGKPFGVHFRGPRPISEVTEAKFRSFLGQILTFPDPPANLVNLYRTLVRSLQLATLVTHSLTHSLLLSRLDWCDPGVWRCQLKACWGCYCCWCWRWGSCWQQFVADFDAVVWPKG